MFFRPPWPRERLDKLLRLMLSTTFDGEREAAARAIGRLLASQPASDPGGRNQLRNKARLDHIPGALGQKGPQEGPQGRTLQ